MKHIIILGDGMADLPVERLGGKTLLQYARKPMMDQLAREGRTGRLVTVPEGFPPGSEVANTAILGYDLEKVYEGRGPLEAASIGYEMKPDDFAIRCNIITLEDGKIITHNGGNLQTEDARVLVDYLNEKLAKPINERERQRLSGQRFQALQSSPVPEDFERVKFICGIQYRHLLAAPRPPRRGVAPAAGGACLFGMLRLSRNKRNSPHAPADRRPHQRADLEIAGTAAPASLQPREGCQG